MLMLGGTFGTGHHAAETAAATLALISVRDYLAAPVADRLPPNE